MMSRRSLFGAVAFAGAVVLSSCSGSPVQQNGALPRVQQQSVVPTVSSPPAPSVKITEYPVFSHPQNPAIGPDGAVWFGQDTGEYQPVLYVYRFAANDGQGRFYALGSLMNPYPEFRGLWSQTGPLTSFAGSMWISFNAFTELTTSDYFTPEEGGFVQMTPQGRALKATVIYRGALVGGSALQGNHLWTLATRSFGYDDDVESYTFENGALKYGTSLNMSPDVPENSKTLRAGPDGNIYALTFVNFSGVWKVSPSAKLLGKYQLNLYPPVDMAFGSDGAMWITTSCIDKYGDPVCTTPPIVRMTTNGIRSLHQIPYAGSAPTAITLGRDGAMWFVDAGRNAIGRITMGGWFTEYRVPTPNAFLVYGNPTGGGIVACPVGVAACGSGDIWFTEPNTSKLGRIHINS